ncbi:scarecrow-like protein 14 [Phtheirospermum japonicum]|uniref:Scarecrow-like protein 14 n=1 Tax=Phtheirospermum japonicum TaxID=374723 RepID=A0A830BYK8_9LAMI|nr:scarecrow-like protein 14 [Phtheirospermum japonicum]
MEEEDDLENQEILHDFVALQATEKSLYDALNNNNNNNLHEYNDRLINSDYEFLEQNKKTRNREDADLTEEHHRSNKQSANSDVSESEPLEMYDDFLLRSDSDNDVSESEPLEMYDDFLLRSDSGKSNNKSRGKKQDMPKKKKEFVDLKSLLLQCAQAVADLDKRTVNDLMKRIRHYSSPQGDGAERVSHYFANALESRLSGNGTSLLAVYNYKRTSVSEILKAHKMLITACPFMTMSNLFAKQTLMKLAKGATTLHVVDFGILFGFQWPCLIQALSERPGGPPKLRITGIDFPQPGFRPAERIEDTGQRLSKYCERFRVPFEYNAIAQKWETIRPEDLKIEKDEVVVVNCIYKLHTVMDEADTVNSPRDAVFNLMKKINPDMFVHGVVNATYNTPFFVARFREAFFHFSALFDMFEATEDEDQKIRVAFEEHVFGKGMMNIIACEGKDRIERPETYKQWEFRTRRAGFRQLPIDGEIVKCVAKVKTDYYYHKDFSVDEDGEWIVLGWKGRVIHAISCWQPVSR